jgi:hypothetical protein
LTNGDKKCLYHAILELWPVGEINLEELKFLSKVYVGMEQLEENINYFSWYH